jgi:Na+-transporting methylmalonyl-CoA/oxaloacetate decarboxylase beta subunit
MPPLTEVLLGVTAFAAGLSVGWIRRIILQRSVKRRWSPSEVLFGAVISLVPFAAVLAALLLLNQNRSNQLVIGWAGVAGMLVSRLFIRRLMRDET